MYLGSYMGWNENTPLFIQGTIVTMRHDISDDVPPVFRSVISIGRQFFLKTFPFRKRIHPQMLSPPWQDNKGLRLIQSQRLPQFAGETQPPLFIDRMIVCASECSIDHDAPLCSIMPHFHPYFPIYNRGRRMSRKNGCKHQEINRKTSSS